MLVNTSSSAAGSKVVEFDAVEDGCVAIIVGVVAVVVCEELLDEPESLAEAADSPSPPLLAELVVVVTAENGLWLLI